LKGILFDASDVGEQEEVRMEQHERCCWWWKGVKITTTTTRHDKSFCCLYLFLCMCTAQQQQAQLHFPRGSSIAAADRSKVIKLCAKIIILGVDSEREKERAS